jgi:hypothetical protein
MGVLPAAKAFDTKLVGNASAPATVRPVRIKLRRSRLWEFDLRFDITFSSIFSCCEGVKIYSENCDLENIENVDNNRIFVHGTNLGILLVMARLGYISKSLFC